MTDEFTASVNRFAADLKIPTSFVDRLMVDDDDWSFVVRVHLLLEGALTHLLTRVTQDELRDVFAQMEMERRLRAAKALGLLTPRYRRAIRYMSNLRNKLVHDFGQAEFRFDEHYDDKNQRREFAQTFAGLWDEDSYEIDGKVLSRRESVLAHPRAAIFGFVISFLALADVEIDSTQLKREQEAFRLLNEVMAKSDAEAGSDESVET